MYDRAPFGPVTFDDGEHVYWAISIPSSRWNGFLCPHFSPETAMLIVAAMREHGRDSGDTIVSFEGTTIVVTQDGEEVSRDDLHTYSDGTPYYAIGSHSWMWGYAE